MRTISEIVERAIKSRSIAELESSKMTLFLR